MSFYLGVWNSPTAISDDEAAARYRVLSADKWADPEFDAQVYTFYCRLTSLYPEVEMVQEADIGSCPWACSLDVKGDRVIMAIQPEQCEKVVPQVLALAEQDELVCFDPQAGKVHLPPHLTPAKTSAAAGSACAAALRSDSPSELRIPSASASVSARSPADLEEESHASEPRALGSGRPDSFWP